MESIFTDMTDEELDKYAREFVPEEYEKHDIAKDFVERVDYIGEKIGHLQKSIIGIKEAYLSKDVDEVYRKCAALAEALSKQSMALAWVPSDFGIFDKNTQKRGVIAKSKDVKFEKHGNIIRIKLPELLPHRMYYDSHSKQIKYFYDYDEWHTAYMQAFQKEFETGKFKIYGEKVVFIYLHHVNGKGTRDVDNFETKHMTDILALFILVDDSSRYVSHYEDMIEDRAGEEYTEIIVCPLKDFPKYLSF